MKSLKLKDRRSFIIRNATKEDAKDMMDHMNQIPKESDFLSFGEGEIKRTVETEAQFIENLTKNDNSLLVLAVIDDKIVGHLSFHGGSRPRLKHAGELGICVLKDYWGLGIGKALINYLIHWAEESNIVKKLNLVTREDNERGIKLYSKLGFKKEGLVTRGICINGNYYSSLLMGLELE